MKVVVMYGGKSCEHDISIITAKQAVKNVSKEKKVTEVYITKGGEWVISNSVKCPKDFLDEAKIAKLPKVTLLPNDNKLFLVKKNKLKALFTVDAVLTCFHGVNGEDGSIQGFLQLAGIPFTSSGITASAVAMDKIVCKKFFKGLGLNVVNGLDFSKCEFKNNPESALKSVQKTIKFPAIVKPANLGSSIGISVCNSLEELASAMEIAFHFDTRVLVERALKDFTEVNCSVLCTRGEIRLSPLERPVNWKEFLTFEEKYINNAKDSMSPSREFPFETPFREEIERMARIICRSLDIRGIARLDFLIDKEAEKVYINEINSIPGSPSFYLWKDKFTFTGLIDELIFEAVKKTDETNALSHLFNSDVLKSAPVKTRKS